MNFTGSWRRVHIFNGDTVNAYLPVRFDIVSKVTGDVGTCFDGKCQGLL